jgi:hypothetical protein
MRRRRGVQDSFMEIARSARTESEQTRAISKGD